MEQQRLRGQRLRQARGRAEATPGSRVRPVVTMMLESRPALGEGSEDVALLSLQRAQTQEYRGGLCTMAGPLG